MTENPVTLCIPTKINGIIQKYCKDNGLKEPWFLERTIDEYVLNRAKLVTAITRKLMLPESIDVGEVKRTSKRVSKETCDRLRSVAATSDIGFDSLTRILFEDKLVNMGLLR